MSHNKILLVAIVVVSVLALFCMLTYNWMHTGSLLASYIEPEILGYLAAAGIELSVVGLSITIGTRKWHELETSGFYIVLVLVVIVSFLANVSQGYYTRYGSHITTQTVTNMDWLQGIIGLAATGLISVITMTMAEIIGQYIVQIVHQKKDAESKPETKSQWCRETFKLMPQASPTHVAAVVGSHLGEDVSVATASRSR
jgi:uncharacterized membrane protein YhaH (DUF805 family)